MVDGIGKGSSLASEAIKAALRRNAEATQRMQEAMQRLSPDARTAAPDTRAEFRTSLADGLKEIDNQVRLGDDLVEKALTGEVTDFHEVAAQIKQADLSFKFALRVRNKLIDAYREVMRMNV